MNKETHKVIIADKEFDRELEVIFRGNIKDCIHFMDNKKIITKVGDHFETKDRKFNVYIEKI